MAYQVNVIIQDNGIGLTCFGVNQEPNNYKANDYSDYGGYETNLQDERILEGYFGDMNGKKITRLYYGETVYYHIETEGIDNGEEVDLKIFERDEIPYIDHQLEGDTYSILIKENKGKIAFKIKESWLGLEEKNELQIYHDDYSQYKEEIELFGELDYKGIVSRKFRDNKISLLYPLEDLRLEDGGGNVEYQRFTAQVKGVKNDYEKFKNIFTSSPQEITNNLLATYVPFDKNNDGTFSVGDQIDINISGPDNGSVRVVKVIIEDNFFEVYFHALVGHTDAGNIRFSGKFIEDYFNYSESLVEFEIYNITRLNVVMGFVGRIIFGGHISRVNQTRQWKNVLANFCNFMGKNAVEAASHIISYNWDCSKNTIGELDSNTTTLITDLVNNLRTAPYNFGLTEDKLWEW